MSLLAHTLFALGLQTIIGIITRNWWAGAALPCGYFVGREVAQAEYRWIETFGGGLRANMPWHAAFDPRVWQTIDQFADWAGPLVACIALGLWASQRQKHENGR